jgi:hypothetical protein
MSSLALQPLLSGDSVGGAGLWLDTVQELLGHRNVRTVMIYTHVLNRGPAAVRSPADVLVAGSLPRLPAEGVVLPGRYPAARRSLTPRRARDDWRAKACVVSEIRRSRRLDSCVLGCTELQCPRNYPEPSKSS